MHPFQRFHVRVDVLAKDADAVQVFVQFFRHPFGQGGYQHAFLGGDSLLDFMQEVVYLVLCRDNLDHRFRNACRADELLDDDSAAFSSS